jgi:hypothetical protein
VCGIRFGLLESSILRRIFLCVFLGDVLGKSGVSGVVFGGYLWEQSVGSVVSGWLFWVRLKFGTFRSLFLFALVLRLRRF